MAELTRISTKTPKKKRPKTVYEYTLKTSIRKTPFELNKTKKFTIGRKSKNDLTINQLTTSDPYLFKSNHFFMGDTQRWAGLSQLSTFGYIDISLATHNVLKESVSQSRNLLKRSRFSYSNAELCLYLAEKYNLPESYCELFRKHFWRKGLKVAFFEMDAQLSEEAKSHIENLTLKDRILYYGARNKVVNFLVRLTIILRHKIEKKYRSRYRL